MTQTRTGSLVESLANIAIGFGINWAANMLVLPLFGFHVTGSQAFGIGVIFTVISLIRSYVLRRWFNGLRWGHRAEAKVAPEVAGIVHREFGPTGVSLPSYAPGRERAP